ncbi:23S rRNA pseudouridine(2604) synthase RluF [Anaerocolumna sp.]|uniref:23S rRNA pseudouridine(2604) synthase RluF n=1 Tax=Anaerocolumna sp. TaxID=2041569 RepID=UPI0028ACF842|nr:23S rRNA pseudouridine(2604) synthase RluF [Anaerocolumna sp.]
MAKRTKKLMETNQTEEPVRLNKFLSDAGICSRREADEHIAAGHVMVDGITAVMGTKVRKGQKVIFQGKVITKDEHLVLIAFNKPRGIVCTTNRSEKDNIVDYINYRKRIYPIGRLDKDSEGLILLTNDGDIVNKILRAGNNHEKEYIVTVNKPITSEFLKEMSEGVPILDTITKPCKLKAVDKFTFHIILTQGLNRQIRRMCEYFDYKVLTLKRIRIMNINLGHLHIGDYRNVTEKEMEGLKELLSNSVSQPLSNEDLMNLWGEDSNDDIYLEGNQIQKDKESKRGTTKKDTRKKATIKSKSLVSRRSSENKSLREDMSEQNKRYSGNSYDNKKSSEVKKSYKTKNSHEMKKPYETKDSREKNSYEARNSHEKNSYEARNAHDKKNSYEARNAHDKKNLNEARNAHDKKNSYEARNLHDKKNSYEARNAHEKNSYEARNSHDKKNSYETRNAHEKKNSYEVRNAHEKKNLNEARNSHDKKNSYEARNSYEKNSHEMKKSYETRNSYEKKSYGTKNTTGINNKSRQKDSNGLNRTFENRKNYKKGGR